MNKGNEQLGRMKSLMTYGLQTENKKNTFASLEYNRIGADGKVYGIVREGTKFYIKVSDKTKNFLKEDFKYIGGFCNRKDYEYSSYASALKNFDFKMRSLNEAFANKDDKIVTESWNPERNEFVIVEATQKMKDEIARQRQIMSNSVIIDEGKSGCVDNSCPSSKKSKGKLGLETGDAENANGTGFEEDVPKETDVEGGIYRQIGEGKEGEGAVGTGDAENANGVGFEEDAPKESEIEGGIYRQIGEGKDSKLGLETGDAENANGTGFEEDVPKETDVEGGIYRQIGEGKEGEDAIEDEPIDTEGESEDVEGEPEDDVIDDEPLDVEGEPEDDVVDDEPIDDTVETDDEGVDEIASLKTELESLKGMISAIADKIGVSSTEMADAEFADDNLYDDEGEFDIDLDFDSNGDEFGDDDFDADGEFGDEDFGDEDEFGDEDDDDVEIYESKNFRSLRLNEDKLDCFGKHPSYRKQPMTLPPSEESEEPYGEDKGDSDPFTLTREKITNAIAESVKKILKKK